MTGAAALVASWLAIGALLATYKLRKSYQRLYVSGSSESMCAPVVNVNHFLSVPVKCLTSSAQCPPVCSSCHWHAMNVGTLIFGTDVTGFSGGATEAAW